MLNREIEQQLRDCHINNGFLFPEYEGFCFANIPATVAAVLDAHKNSPLPHEVFADVETDVDNVVLILIDGFGYNRWLRDYKEHAFFRALTDTGTVTPLTSIFPSQTTAALTTIHTGQTPAEHGLLGRTMFLKDPGFVLHPLTFSQNGGAAGDAAEFIDPSELFESEHIYDHLVNEGANTHTFVPTPILERTYAQWKLSASESHGYNTVAEMAVRLRKTLENEQGRTYCYTYLPHIDQASHHYGRTSEEYQALLAMISGCLRRELINRLNAETTKETLLLVAADHGHINTDPIANDDLLSHEIIAESLQCDQEGRPVPPTGGERYVHLHLQPDRIESVQEFLTTTLDGLTLTRSEAISGGLFGSTAVSDQTERRCGDVIFIPKHDAAWYDDTTSSLDLTGSDESTVGPISVHGGLSPQEMLVPFGAVNLSSL